MTLLRRDKAERVWGAADVVEVTDKVAGHSWVRWRRYRGGPIGGDMEPERNRVVDVADHLALVGLCAGGCLARYVREGIYRNTKDGTLFAGYRWVGFTRGADDG